MTEKAKVALHKRAEVKAQEIIRVVPLLAFGWRGLTVEGVLYDFALQELENAQNKKRK